MRLIADLHIHSGYSRGCSKQLTLPNIAKWCEHKGIDLVSTGDFTHPAWFKSIKSELIPAESGFYQLKNGTSSVKFVIGTEISCIYSQGGKCRRIHMCLLAPSIEATEKLIDNLTKRGCNLKSDGRPIIGLSGKELVRIALEIDPDYFCFPAHVWTPWFSVFGSKSGFDSVEECFEEMSEHIFALETGLSSDPAMNRKLSQLDRFALVSNSDAHSLINLGREANVFEMKNENFNFNDLTDAIKGKGNNKLVSTIEFFPEEGKYHIDGHADCKFSCLPEVSRKNKNLCPKCGKQLILGVLNRVSELADRTDYDQNKFAPFKCIIPLQEIIADEFKVCKNSKKVMNKYFNIVKNHSEFAVLLDIDEKELKNITSAEIADKIIKIRRGDVLIEPGYDGIYGKIMMAEAQKNK